MDAWSGIPATPSWDEMRVLSSAVGVGEIDWRGPWIYDMFSELEILVRSGCANLLIIRNSHVQEERDNERRVLFVPVS